MNFVTSPGWVMLLAWGLYLSLIFLFFEEPHRPPVSKPVSRGSSDKNLFGMDCSPTSTLHAPLLSDSSPHPLFIGDNKDSDTTDEEAEGDSDYGEDKPVETVADLLKELTMPIKILLWIYFMLKFASEILISESSILTYYYFNWTTPQVREFIVTISSYFTEMCFYACACVHQRFYIYTNCTHDEY